MNISLSPDLEQFVNQQVAKGTYASVNDVIRDSLRLLKDREEQDATRLEELRREIAVGIKEADNGELLDGPEVFRRLRERAQRAGADSNE